MKSSELGNRKKVLEKQEKTLRKTRKKLYKLMTNPMAKTLELDDIYLFEYEIRVIDENTRTIYTKLEEYGQ